MTRPEAQTAPASLLVAAFAAVYLVWGSTYLAIRVAVESLPPFLMAATRFFVAGSILLLVLRSLGSPWPTRRHWINGAGIGTLLLLGGAGTVGWAEQTVASGLAALIVATTPLWFVILEWLPPWRRRPAASTLVGLAIGFCGVALLVAPMKTGNLATDAAQPASSIGGIIALLFACLSWATGSLIQRRLNQHASPWMNAAVQMICGSAALLLAATISGEWDRLQLDSLPWRSTAALAYLIVFGSWIGFGAYVWLLKHSTPARVSTYAYVNPLIAVWLGWFFLNEPVTARIAWAATVIVGGVLIVQWPRRPQP